MTLSLRDQQILAVIEREFADRDPRLARQLTSFRNPRPFWRRAVGVLLRRGNPDSQETENTTGSDGQDY
ncbi:hypothetical protein P3T36_004278 [Kitasatospora sp. MAP12-15]|uniref:DUF3040 domain-containing protein n=1 Tax=unclassified Kitasatospora TaxID=2633591 RepID=UPI0024739216|nr:DUF3040 domain-containing protein [Kitasatospora sp. MAP12-44]MDH6108257.1 hypothetical protein [Kitasatospora sp. MAP12-44]